MDVLKLFKKGLAVGQSDIRGDCLHFRFHDEFFIVKDRSLKIEKRGPYLIAPVKEVRKHG